MIVVHLTVITLTSLSQFSYAAASKCYAQPVALPLKDIQVLPKVKGSYMRGIPVKVGTPPQDLVVMPWAELNNTWLYDYEAYCDNSIIWNDVICAVRRGEYFYENASSTYQQSSDIRTAGGATVETGAKGAELGIPELLSTSLGGTDTVALADDQLLRLDKFPLGIPRLNWDHGYTIMHALGLGANSTLLNQLVAMGRIRSRTWSIFWGRMWNSRPLDGSVVLGGYDRDKTIGANYTQRLDYSDTTGCWTGMKVTVLDIQIITRDGKSSSLFPPNYSLPVYIVPQRQLLIEAPWSVATQFEQLTQTSHVTDTGINGASTELHWGALTYSSSPESKFFGGDLSISLSSGLSVRVPNDQFMVPKAYVDRNGTRLFDRNYREFLLSPLADDGNPATLGRYFLTAAYLMVDHDAGTFTLWRANPTSSSSLVPVVAEKRAADGCGGDMPGVVQPSATVNSNPESSESDNGRLSSGVIAGIAIGATVGVLAILGLAGLFLVRKRRQGRAAESTTSMTINDNNNDNNNHYTGSSMTYAPSGWSAVPAQQHITAPQELHGKTVWAQDKGFERPADNVPYELDSNSYSPGTSH
ncbi:aspartic peptidase domain-containing protein [Apiospora arundinis]|uniref:Aspartic peptidase domain-containing protein n=1 Tax=Apiospora arundinis TaxID=335852 RepID=A0ABR2HKT9_9PEZI